MTRRVKEGIRIEDLMLSCRVQGKFVEKALLHHLCTRPETVTGFVEIVFRTTDRNAAARAILSDLGFAETGGGLLRVAVPDDRFEPGFLRSEEHTSELQSLMRISYAVFCLKNKKQP